MIKYIISVVLFLASALALDGDNHRPKVLQANPDMLGDLDIILETICSYFFYHGTSFFKFPIVEQRFCYENTRNRKST